MKQFFVLPFLLLFALSLSDRLIAQDTSTVLSITNPTSIGEAKTLAIPSQLLATNAKVVLPMFRVPESFYKQYMIRVLQLEDRSLKQLSDSPFGYLYSAKSADHDGYDYYLPVGFKKREWMEAFMSRLPANLSRSAVVVKMEPKMAKCHCFGKF